MIKFGRLIL